MKPQVIGVGEVLWDQLPSGPQLGGAPGNFAHHARALGAQARLISRVGHDEPGREIVRRFADLGLAECALQVDETAPTGKVTVALSGDGIPHFTIHEDVAWDRLVATPEALATARRADAICFGSLAQRNEISRAAIQALVAAAPATALRIFDINLRQHFYGREIIERSLELANVLKLNDCELPVLAKLFHLLEDPPQQVAALADRFDLSVVALTRGAHGSLLYRGGQWSDCAARPVEVKDTVGAGDAFTAALAIGLWLKMDLDEVHFAASEVARYVCSCAGATPPLPESLTDLFKRNLGSDS